MLKLITCTGSSAVRRAVTPRPLMLVPVATFKSNKHWNPKYKTHRGMKVIKVELPDFYSDEADLDPSAMSPEEVRSKMKERGLQPSPAWSERSFSLNSTSEVFEPYVPPEGDGKMSILTIGGTKQTAIRLGKKTRSWQTFRKIRQYDEDFEDDEFAVQALDIYKDLHKTMSELKPDRVDRQKIRTLVTERAYPEVMANLWLKIVKWDFIESLEPARVVHARHTSLITKDNFFAQITVRFHTKQVLAVYDRFGRLCHGNPLVAKDVLEYVVFEKHISSLYGNWRIHKKLIPDWLKDESVSLRTLRIDPETEEPPEALPPPPSEGSTTTALPAEPSGAQPQLAAA